MKRARVLLPGEVFLGLQDLPVVALRVDPVVLEVLALARAHVAGEKIDRCLGR